MKTSEIVKASKVSRFHRFRDGTFVYETDTGFQFPIPLHEIYGGGSFGKEATDEKVTLSAEERTITLMRWIRKHVDAINASPEDSSHWSMTSVVKSPPSRICQRSSGS